jgi:hypothetical protein
MGDVIVQKARQKREFKFVFKRKIFLPSHNVPSEDNMFSRLVYLQVGVFVFKLVCRNSKVYIYVEAWHFERACATRAFQLPSNLTPRDWCVTGWPLAFAAREKAEDEVITQGKLPLKAEAAVVKLSAISYRVALDEDWPADADAMAEHAECPVIGETRRSSYRLRTLIYSLVL